MRVTPPASYSVYLRCLEFHIGDAEEYCVDVYNASYYAMNAALVAYFTWSGWRVYAATKRVTTSLNEHLL